MADLHWVAYLGIILGVLLRTWLPYYVKSAKAGAPLTFDWRYLVSAVGAFIAAIMTAQPLFADFILPATTTNPLLAFWSGLIYAGIWNTLVNAFYLDYRAPA